MSGIPFTQNGPNPKTEPVFYVKLLSQGGAKPSFGAQNLDLTDYCIKLTFEDKGRCADKLVLTVNNSTLQFFDDPVWRKGNLLEVSWGYPGLLTPARQMVIDKVTGFTELKVECHSKGMLLNKQNRARVFRQMKHSDIVKKILGEYGYTNFQYIQDTTEVVSASQAGMTDAQFLQHLANKHGYDFFVDFDGPHWHQPPYDQPPSRTYVWYTGDRGEIKKINIKNDVLSQPAFIVTTGRDPLTKKTYTNVHGNTTVPRQGLAPNASETTPFDPNSPSVPKTVPEGTTFETQYYLSGENREKVGIKVIRHAGTKEQAKQTGDGAFRRAQQMTVKLTAEIIGNPKLVAKSVIEIQGISKRLSGRYYIDKIKHSISSKGYVCNIECHRDGDNDPNSAQNKAKINTQPGSDKAVVKEYLSGESRESNITAERGLDKNGNPTTGYQVNQLRRIDVRQFPR
jgi:phage protein D